MNFLGKPLLVCKGDPNFSVVLCQSLSLSTLGKGQRARHFQNLSRKLQGSIQVVPRIRTDTTIQQHTHNTPFLDTVILKAVQNYSKKMQAGLSFHTGSDWRTSLLQVKLVQLPVTCSVLPLRIHCQTSDYLCLILSIFMSKAITSAVISVRVYFLKISQGFSKYLGYLWKQNYSGSKYFVLQYVPSF